jgi:hypothetical protein
LGRQKSLKIVREKPKTIAMRPVETPETKDLGRRYQATCAPITALPSVRRRSTTSGWVGQKKYRWEFGTSYLIAFPCPLLAYNAALGAATTEEGPVR